MSVWVGYSVVYLACMILVHFTMFFFLIIIYYILFAVVDFSPFWLSRMVRKSNDNLMGLLLLVYLQDLVKQSPRGSHNAFYHAHNFEPQRHTCQAAYRDRGVMIYCAGFTSD